MERFRAIFQGVENPRKSNAKKHDLNEMLMIALLACWRAWSSHKFDRAMHRPVAGLRQGRRRERNIMVEIQKFDHPTRASFGRKIGWNI